MNMKMMPLLLFSLIMSVITCVGTESERKLSLYTGGILASKEVLKKRFAQESHRFFGHSGETLLTKCADVFIDKFADKYLYSNEVHARVPWVWYTFCRDNKCQDQEKACKNWEDEVMRILLADQPAALKDLTDNECSGLKRLRHADCPDTCCVQEKQEEIWYDQLAETVCRKTNPTQEELKQLVFQIWRLKKKLNFNEPQGFFLISFENRKPDEKEWNFIGKEDLQAWKQEFAKQADAGDEKGA